MKKIKLTDPLPQWQNPVQSTGRKPTYRTGPTANLTNLRENYNNKIQTIGDILKERYGMPEDSSKVAIPIPSSNTVSDVKKVEDIGPDTPVTTGKEQEYRIGINANTSDTRNNGKLTGTESLRHSTLPTVNKREITVVETPEPPFVNGEKWEEKRINNMGHVANDPNIKSAYEQ